MRIEKCGSTWMGRMSKSCCDRLRCDRLRCDRMRCEGLGWVAEGNPNCNLQFAGAPCVTRICVGTRAWQGSS